MSLLRSACLALSVLGLACGVAAQAPYPAKPVRLVVPYPPGASNDVQSLRSGDVKERFAREGGERVIMTRTEFTEFVRQEIERWRKVAREANIQPEG